MTDTWQRLDRVLVNMGLGSRTVVQRLIRQGRVSHRGLIVKDPGLHIDTSCAQIEIDGVKWRYTPYSYYMLNKPPGLVSASKSRGATERIVMEVIANEDRRPGLFPVGRLDKDSEGLLLICNDGHLAHRLLAPRNRVAKRYLVSYEGHLDGHAVSVFQQGLVLENGEVCLPSELILLAEDNRSGQAEVVLYEGKYHQVKRMLQEMGCRVHRLQRVSFGPLELDPLLQPGAYRPLTDKEIAALYSAAI